MAAEAREQYGNIEEAQTSRFSLAFGASEIDGA
jgi:hypothetical protein